MSLLNLLVSLPLMHIYIEVGLALSLKQFSHWTIVAQHNTSSSLVVIGFPTSRNLIVSHRFRTKYKKSIRKGV
jgi:hypothetical protein